MGVFTRACDIFIPPGRPQIRLVYAKYLEENGKIQDARRVLESIRKDRMWHPVLLKL